MFYKVKAKCGHVGRNHYIVKNFYVIASSGKEAAYNVRYLPRVKHNRKDAILSVKKISKDEFSVGVAKNQADKYFRVTNSSEQRMLRAVEPQEIRQEPQRVNYKKIRNIDFKVKKRKILEKHYNQMLSEEIYG